MKASLTNNTYFSSIDGLRAIAVMLVVLYHFEFDYFDKGYLGVDVFFVISGFLISRKILLDIGDGRFCLLEFYLSRIRRLFPALFTTVLLTLIGAALLFSADGLIRVSSSAIASVASMANIRFLLVTGYFDVGATMKPLLHFWSLSVEEQFYLIWPLIFLLIAKRFRVLIVVISVLGIASLMAVAFFHQSHSELVFFLMPFRVYEFSLGAVLAIVELKRNRQPNFINRGVIPVAFITASALLLVTALTHYSSVIMPSYVSNLLICISTVILLCVRESAVSSLLLSNRVCSAIGKLSYSLYLVHWPLWVFVAHAHVESLSLQAKALLVVVALVMAYGLHVLIEKPFRFNASTKMLNVFLLGTLVLIVLMCASIRSSSGWKWRIEQPESAFIPSKLECKRDHTPIMSQHCVFGDVETFTHTSLLIGDSHSMSLLQGLNAFGEKHAIKFRSISYPGCPPLDLSLTLQNQGVINTSRCEVALQRVEEFLAQEKVDSIFIAGRWLWLKDHQVYGKHKHSKSILLGAEVAGESVDNAALAWRSEIQSVVERFSRSVGKVVVFSQVPLLQKHIGECDKLPNLFTESKDLKKRCAVNGTYQQITADLAFTDKTIESLESKSVFPITPSNLVCDPLTQSCQIITDQGLLYVDESHLSQWGGLRLIQAHEPQLKAFLNLK